MRIQVRYFASLRETLGDGQALEGCTAATVGALRDALMAQSARHAQALSRERALRCALDRRMCDEGTELAGATEVAFFPPVTGG